tara:strand:+ start:343 stop:1251 length:909 start_codon:yes stop_codon:yes gene_type:complete
MKNIKYLILSLFTVISLGACVENDNDELTGGATTGGLLSVNNQLISYVVGSGATYVATGSVFQGREQTTSIDIYKSFTNNTTGAVSNEVLLKTITIGDTTMGTTFGFDLTFTYEELITDLTIDGAPLPANDGNLNIGDYWSLRYASNTSEGDLNFNAKTTKVAVGTRYAGVYTVEDSSYFRLGVDGGNWNGTDRIIESVNATIYRHKGVGFWDDNEFYFTVDNATGVITIMDVDLDGNGVNLNGQPIMTCESNNGFTVLACGASSSMAVPDDVDGADELIMTVGYLTAGSGPREFFQRMVKQ